MSLKQRLIEQITWGGPISVADYVHICLLDPKDGYYTHNVAFGEDGDFITAPMISQMFGEMIGVWVAQLWRGLGSPGRFRLVEIGGGDGTLMSDVVRVADKVPGLRKAAAITFVEPARNLAIRQAKAVANSVFVDDLASLATDMPMILVANEVLDCLPARQFVRTETGWHERRVGLRDGELVFGLSEAPGFAPPPGETPLGEIVEISLAQAQFVQQLADILAIASGAALLIDYGRSAPGTGDTLQAMHRHHRCDPLEAPGKHDLTMWADFPAIREMFVNTQVKCSEITTQSVFLKGLGLEDRLNSLRTQNRDQSAKLERQCNRLTATGEMGDLFKVVALASPPGLALPGLEPAAAQD